MTAELYFLMTAICLGAMMQVGVGIGFSIIAGPPMMIMLGTPTAVPILLLLNTVVSAVATDWHVLKNNQQLIVTAVIGCCVGVAAGRIVYPFLSEAFVLALTACLLLIGLITTLLPLRGFIGNVGFSTVTGLSGLATIWAATPGPLMVFGLIAKGQPAKEVAKLIQPIALVAYGIAFLLHNLSGAQPLSYGSSLLGLVAITLIGSLLGRAAGPYLPNSVVIAAIRVVSLIACCVLFYRAYMTA